MACISAKAASSRLACSTITSRYFASFWLSIPRPAKRRAKPPTEVSGFRISCTTASRVWRMVSSLSLRRSLGSMRLLAAGSMRRIRRERAWLAFSATAKRSAWSFKPISMAAPAWPACSKERASRSASWVSLNPNHSRPRRCTPSMEARAQKSPSTPRRAKSTTLAKGEAGGSSPGGGGAKAATMRSGKLQVAMVEPQAFFFPGHLFAQQGGEAGEVAFFRLGELGQQEGQTDLRDQAGHEGLFRLGQGMGLGQVLGQHGPVQAGAPIDQVVLASGRQGQGFPQADGKGHHPHLLHAQQDHGPFNRGHLFRAPAIGRRVHQAQQAGGQRGVMLDNLGQIAGAGVLLGGQVHQAHRQGGEGGQGFPAQDVINQLVAVQVSALLKLTFNCYFNTGRLQTKRRSRP